MPQQFNPAALQQYYSIAMGQPIAQPMVNPEQINQYNQQTIPVAVPVSDVESYAQQQFQPQVPMPQQAQQQNTQFQIQKKRMDYAAMIEQRFNEIADHVGGVNALVQTNNLEAARKKAADDIRMMFGDPPEIQQEPRIIEMGGNQIAVGGPIKNAMLLPTEAEKQSQQLAVKKAEAELAQAEQKSKLEAGKSQQESAGSLTGLVQSVRIFDQASKLAKSMRSSPVLAQTVGGGNLILAGVKAFERNVPGTPEFDFSANANRLKSAAFAQAITMLKGMGALSNAEGQAITNSLTDVDNLKQSPEQYQKRLDEFSSLMDALIASKQKELALIQGQAAKSPSLNLETFDFGSLPIDNSGLPADPNASAPQPVQEGFTRQVWNGNELK